MICLFGYNQAISTGLAEDCRDESGRTATPGQRTNSRCQGFARSPPVVGRLLYLAGYAVECGLKACIAKLMKAEEFPDKSFAEKCWTHDVDRLVLLAGLRDQRDADSKVDIQFRETWATVNEWDESSRYARTNKTDAQDLLDSVIDTKHGVLPWIKLHW
jgi:hypothetical protein